MAESNAIFSKLRAKRRKYNTKTKEINANISELKWSTEIVYYCLINNRNMWKPIRCPNSRTQRWAPGTTSLVQFGIYFDTFWKTHSCKWIPNWMRKVVWLLILPKIYNHIMSFHSHSIQQFLTSNWVILSRTLKLGHFRKFSHISFSKYLLAFLLRLSWLQWVWPICKPKCLRSFNKDGGSAGNIFYRFVRSR